jgi:hypothetical protein
MSTSTLTPLHGSALLSGAAGACAATAAQNWQDLCARPVFTAFQGGAVTETGADTVTDLMGSTDDPMVIDRTYSTRLGLFSCRPPV